MLSFVNIYNFNFYYFEVYFKIIKMEVLIYRQLYQNFNFYYFEVYFKIIKMEVLIYRQLYQNFNF
jgi:hypothetical protein